jgi:hypothetical protein
MCRVPWLHPRGRNGHTFPSKRQGHCKWDETGANPTGKYYAVPHMMAMLGILDHGGVLRLRNRWRSKRRLSFSLGTSRQDPVGTSSASAFSRMNRLADTTSSAAEAAVLNNFCSARYEETLTGRVETPIHGAAASRRRFWFIPSTHVLTESSTALGESTHGVGVFD